MAMTTDYEYVGHELDLFAKASNWKAYLNRQVSPYIGRHVLEIGAGLGGTTLHLCTGAHDRWLCLEPDRELARRLEAAIKAGELPPCCQVELGTVHDQPAEPAFDTLLYIDVLEHIEDDARELARAARLLRPGGHVVVLSPAHQSLYTPFDAAIGHYRRYSKKALSALTPSGLQLVRLRYLDAVGMVASLGNRLILNQSMPTARQIALWDGIMVRISRLIDPVTAYSLGKSVLAVWKKPGPEGESRVSR
jgi:SAM-dependent methyltransferase